MTHKSLVVLVVLNLVLLTGLLLTGGPQPAAQAQFAAQRDFQIIAAENDDNDFDVIYVFEATTGELRAFQFSSADGRTLAVGRRNLSADINRRGNAR